MKHYLLLIVTTLILALTASAQRTIENPVIGARSMGACTGFFIDKIELKDNATKLYLTNYHGYKEGWFRLASGTTLRAGDKRWQVTSAEGIDLDTQVYPKDDVEFVTHFVLNFPAIDASLEAVDFVEADDPNAYNLYDIALTDRKAEEIKQRITIPDHIKNYAANIKDNGKSLEPEEFTMEPATIKGKIYGLDLRTFGGAKVEFGIEVNIENPFLRRETVAAEIKPDNTFEIQVPMTVNHQDVWLRVKPIYSDHVVITAGKTVEVYFDFTQIYKPWELPDNKVTPYFAGENVDLNYAINLPFIRNFRNELVYNDESRKKVAYFTMPQYKQYILDGYDDYAKRIDAMPITKRAKEFLTLSLKFESANFLSRAYMDLPSFKARLNNEETIYMQVADQDFIDYPKILDIDHIMMFYTYDMASLLQAWGSSCNRWFQYYHWYGLSDGFDAKIWETLAAKEKLSKKEKNISASIAKKIRGRDTTRTAAEIAFVKKYIDKYEQYANEEQQRLAEMEKAFCDDVFRDGEGFFLDFYDVQGYCYDIKRGVVVPDSVIRKVEQMRNPFYAKYIKAKNAETIAKIEAEKARGGYFAHHAGESKTDSLLVELLKEHKGKVVLIDFWNTWCGPCRVAMKNMEPMKAEFEGKDVVFLYLADVSSPENEYNDLIPTVKGVHHRLPESDYDALKRKWNISGIPAYILIGKDGTVKDRDGYGTEYFREKINEELNK